MNNSRNETVDLNVTLAGLNLRVPIFTESFISVLGFILSTLCVVTFCEINKRFKTSGQMYKYLLMKSICDFILFSSLILHIVYNYSSYHLHYTYILQFNFKYLYRFLNQLLMLYSVYFELLATIDCYLSIGNKYKFLLSKKAFYLSSFLNIFLFFIFYIGKIFVYEIIPFNSSISSKVLYKTVKNSLYFSYFYKILSILFLVFRDILSFILLLIFNILIFLNIKKLSAKKRLLKNNKALLVSIKAQENKVKMIYLSAFNSILLHLPSIVENLYGKYQKGDFWTYYDSFSFNVIIISYCTPFIIYTLFNKVFRDHLLKLLNFKRVITITPSQSLMTSNV
jgi:hypothetical protein